MSEQEPQAGAARIPQQVAVIAVRSVDDGVEVCLIRRRDPGQLGIPKGYVDPGDSPEQAALTEAFEEAGLRGHLIGGSIGTYDYKKWCAPLTVAVYLMKVVEEQEHWQEKRLRERSWHSTRDAAVLLASHPIARMWERVAERLEAVEKQTRRTAGPI